MNRIRPPLGLAAALTALALGAPASPAAADWPMYGHDVANTRNGGSSGPAPGHVPELRRRWRFVIADGPVTGTPAVHGGRVFAAATGGTVVALDAATGKPLWKHDAGYEVHASLATAGGLVLVPVSHVGAPFVLALDPKTGKQVWKAVVDHQRATDLYGSPVPWHGSVFIGVSSLHAEFYAQEGRPRGSVVALDLATGKRRWKTYTVPKSRDGASVWTTPAIDAKAGRLFVGTGNAYDPPAAPTTDAVLALDVATGTLVASYQATAQDWWNGYQANDPGAGPDADFGASPNLFVDGAGHALVGEAQKPGLYWGLDRRTLAPRWSTRVAPASEREALIGSTAYDGHRIYGPESDGAHVWAIGSNGALAWDRDEAGGTRYASVAVARGVLYGADGAGHLVARRTTDGARIASWPLGARSWGGVAIAGGAVFTVTGTTDDNVGSVVAFARRPQPRG